MNKEAQTQFLNRLLRNIKEYEEATGDKIDSVGFDVEQSTFEICLKERTKKLN